MSMICPNSCPASTGVVLGNDPPHPRFYAVSAKFAKLQYELDESAFQDEASEEIEEADGAVIDSDVD